MKGNTQKLLNLAHDGNQSIYNQMYWDMVVDKKLNYRSLRDYKTDNAYDNYKKFIEANPDIRIILVDLPDTKAEKEKIEFEVLLETPSCAVLYISSSKFGINFAVSAESEEQSLKYIDILVNTFPERKKIEHEQSLKLDFWYQGNEPVSVTRTIEVPNWSEVCHNYPPKIASQITELIKLNRPVDSEKLIILNGLPGCGKTFLLRTLLWEWRDWAKGDFVLDPEKLFSSPSYMLSLVLDAEETNSPFSFMHEEEDEETKRKWRILILEDSDAYISTSAKAEYGQATSRLLNLLDGLVGQGLNLMVIMTANEEDNKIHDAIKRPGRCRSNILFEGFSREEAIDWLQFHGLDESHLPQGKSEGVGFRKGKTDMYTLATLYHVLKQAKKESTDQLDESEGLGPTGEADQQDSERSDLGHKDVTIQITEEMINAY